MTSSNVASNHVSATMCWSAYIVSTACAIMAIPYVHSFFPSFGPLGTSIVLDLGATAIVYAFSFLNGNSSIYDPYWCTTPLWLGFFFKSEAPGGFWFYEPRETLCLLLLWGWAIRFLVGIPWEGWTTGLHTEDWRYVKFQKQMPSAFYWAFSLSSFHVTPTLLVFAALAPVARVLLQGTSAPPLNVLDAAAAFLTLSGIVIEGVADHQLRRFRREQERRGDGASATCDRGLWQWSRHPNYCGECTFWTGLLGFGISSGAVAAEPALAIGAPLMWAFFRFASVPLMDDRSLERGRRGYEAMMQTTSPLLLWPPIHVRANLADMRG